MLDLRYIRDTLAPDSVLRITVQNTQVNSGRGRSNYLLQQPFPRVSEAQRLGPHRATRVAHHPEEVDDML